MLCHIKRDRGVDAGRDEESPVDGSKSRREHTVSMLLVAAEERVCAIIPELHRGVPRGGHHHAPAGVRARADRGDPHSMRREALHVRRSRDSFGALPSPGCGVDQADVVVVTTAEEQPRRRVEHQRADRSGLPTHVGANVPDPLVALKAHDADLTRAAAAPQEAAVAARGEAVDRARLLPVHGAFGAVCSPGVFATPLRRIPVLALRSQAVGGDLCLQAVHAQVPDVEGSRGPT
mmetsp:Transcript_37329/g.105402  ORF Transcript_37329/g.105402 Transcript_37329/m.105402 type:complete len:234 (-) Transcript_37329:519-1220(-)